MAMAAFGSCLYGTLSDIVPAKFVNLFEFCEFKMVLRLFSLSGGHPVVAVCIEFLFIDFVVFVVVGYFSL